MLQSTNIPFLPHISKVCGWVFWAVIYYLVYPSPQKYRAIVSKRGTEWKFFADARADVDGVAVIW
jgi:hypothetical protein